MIGHRQFEFHQFKERLEESLRVTAGQAVNGLDCRHSFNRQVGISRRSARLSGQFIGCPVLDGFGTDPDGATSSLFERGVILTPVADAVSGLLYSGQKKHTTSQHTQCFILIRATKPRESTICADSAFTAHSIEPNTDESKSISLWLA